MKRSSRIIFFILCIILSVGFGFFIQNSDAKEQKYLLNEIETYHLARQEDSIIIQEDPQLIIRNVNTYIKDILLEELYLSEEVQVFFSENGTDFSEENSLFLVPIQTEEGILLSIEKYIETIRIDFEGIIGSSYKLTRIIMNPKGYKDWKIGSFFLYILLGIVAGNCLIIFKTEQKNRRVYWMALKKYRYLLEDMVVRDIKLKYRRSIIGLLWSILNPLLMMCVITAVFQNLFHLTVDNFAVYYLTGWVIFNFVTEATTGAMTSILSSGALIRKVYIPKYIFPIQKCVFSFVNMLFSFIALLAVMLVLHIKFTWKFLLFPIPLILALFFSIGIGMILATVAVFFRDIIHLYTVFTMIWMYLTPIIYPMDILSDRMLGLVKMNPMYYYVDCFRQLMLYGTLPKLSELGIAVAWSIVSVLIGIAIFKKKQDRFILFI